MRIVLDTNILVADRTLRSGPVAILLDYAKRTHSRLYLSQLVLDELKATYLRHLEERWSDYSSAVAQLNRVVGIAVVVAAPKPDLGQLVNEYTRSVLDRLGVRADTILTVSENNLRDAVARGVERRLPCTAAGEEIRDAVIWSQLMDLAATASSHPIAFVSANTKQFGKESLHPALRTEVPDVRAFRYFISLDAFAKQHASQIAFITSTWIQAQVSDELLKDQITAHVYRFLEQLAVRRQTPPLSLEGFWLDLDDHYVYEMEDGTLRVEATWGGIVTASGQFDVPMLFDEEHRFVRQGQEEFDFYAEVELIVSDGVLTSWELLDVSVGY